MGDTDAELEAGLVLSERDLGHDVHGAATVQVLEGRGDLLLDVRLARTALGRLPVQRKLRRLRQSRVGGRGYRGQNRGQYSPERR
jgi:hypothetical protein